MAEPFPDPWKKALSSRSRLKNAHEKISQPGTHHTLELAPLTWQAWSHGMDSVILTEFTANTAAAALYRRMGFTLDKVRALSVHY